MTVTMYHPLEPCAGGCWWCQGRREGQPIVEVRIVRRREHDWQQIYRVVLRTWPDEVPRLPRAVARRIHPRRERRFSIWLALLLVLLSYLPAQRVHTDQA